MQVKDEEVVYNGQVVPKQHFRVFIYNKDGVTRKLVENYEQFEAYLSSGLWFDHDPKQEFEEAAEIAEELESELAPIKVKKAKAKHI